MQRKNCDLEYLELKALSVPSSLQFLIGIEYDVVMCVTEVGNRRFSLHFPVLAETFQKLLSLCAVRFSLTCTHTEEGSVLSGKAVMPLLRYVDYIPGALHPKEIMDCLGVEETVNSPRKRPPREADDGAAAHSPGIEFDACFLDYSEYASEDSLADVHGHRFYLTLDYGLNLATHGHLLGIRFHSDWDVKKSLQEFQEFSGWDTFDLRWYDEQHKKQGGVIVMPSVQDVNDLLERYEDEDSDDEGDLLPFILRPVAPLVAVPAVEDSALKKLREQYWDEIVAFWGRFERTRNTIMVHNLYEGAQPADILAFLPGVEVVRTQFLDDGSPSHRRRLFIEFATADGAKKGLDLDGKSTKGKTLRAQVAPPYISESRRGQEIAPPGPPAGAKKARAAAPAAAAAPATASPKTATATPAAAAAAAPSPSASTPAASPSPKPSAPKGEEAMKEHQTASVHKDPHETTVPAAPVPAPAPAPAAASTLSVPSATTAAAAAPTTKSPMMNVNAREFTPSFALKVDSPAFVPSSHTLSPLPVYLPPPMDDARRPPPPSYDNAVTGSPPPTYNSSYGGVPPGAALPPSAYMLPPSGHAHGHAGPPPPYTE